MSDYIKVNFVIPAEVKAAFKKLPLKAAVHCVKEGVTPILTDTRKTARALAPRKSGLLKKSITRKIKIYTDFNSVISGFYGGVGIDSSVSGKVNRGKRKVFARPSKYAHLVEDGHVIVRNKKVVGQVAPKHFMRPAVAQLGEDLGAGRLMDKFIEGVKKTIAKSGAK